MRWLDSITNSVDMNLSKLQRFGDGEGQGSLEGYSPWGHTELVTTEQLTLSLHFHFSLNTISLALLIQLKLSVLQLKE